MLKGRRDNSRDRGQRRGARRGSPLVKRKGGKTPGRELL